VVLQPTQCGFVEFRVAEHATVWANQRDTMRKSCAGCISQGIRIEAHMPLCADEPGFAKQLGGGRVAQPVAESPVETSDGQYSKDSAHQQ
jgi:hypothetical protein